METTGTRKAGCAYPIPAQHLHPILVDDADETRWL